MGSQWVRNGSATPPQRGLLGALRATPPPHAPPTARGAAGGAARAEPGVAEAPRPGTAPPIPSARSPTATCASHRSQRRPLAMAEQPAAPRRLPTSRYGKAWSLWPLRCAGLVMASGRTTGHRIAQSWRCRRAAVGPICAGSAAHGPRLSLDVLTRVSQALLMGLASWGYGTPLGKHQVAERFGALMKLLEASASAMAAPINAGAAAPAAEAPAADPAAYFHFGSGTHKDVRSGAALLTRVSTCAAPHGGRGRRRQRWRRRRRHRRRRLLLDQERRIARAGFCCLHTCLALLGYR